MPARLHHRRTVLAAAIAVALALAGGCSNVLGTRPEDASLEELQRLLEETGDGELQTLCQAIADGTRDMLAAQTAFLRRFNRQAADTRVDREELIEMVDRNLQNIRQMRGSLLRLQDDLYDRIPEEQWPEVRDLLIATGQVVVEGDRQGPL